MKSKLVFKQKWYRIFNNIYIIAMGVVIGFIVIAIILLLCILKS